MKPAPKVHLPEVPEKWKHDARPWLAGYIAFCRGHTWPGLTDAWTAGFTQAYSDTWRSARAANDHEAAVLLVTYAADVLGDGQT